MARRARRMAARRRHHEQAAGQVPRAGGPDPDLRAAIDREVARLPERYRAPVVLCDLEGMTRAEAARHWAGRKGRWPAGSAGPANSGPPAVACRLGVRGGWTWRAIGLPDDCLGRPVGIDVPDRGRPVGRARSGD